MDLTTAPLPAALPAQVQALRINGPRLWGSLMELAQIGATRP